MSRIRIGTVGYLNTAPLTVALDPERFEVVGDHPRGIAASLASGEVDVALAPVAAVLTDGDFLVVPGWCIGADGPVQSVVIAAETPPEAWTELVLDGTSRTSVVLARLLVTQGPLATRVRPDLRLVEGAPGDGPRRVGGTVAAVVIGDPARVLPVHLERWDLAQLWKQWTGQAFVFAVWAARRGLPAEVRLELARAGRAGVDAIEERWTGDDRDYLLHHIRYPLDDAALIGLRRFAALSHQAGLIGQGEIRLFGPIASARPRRPDLDALLLAAAEGDLPSTEDARSLLLEASPTDLGLAAQARRTRAGRATYLVEHRVDAEGVRAGGEPFLAELRAAVGAGATAVWLHGLGTLSPEACRERLAAAVEAGLQPWGLDAAEIVGRVPDGLAALRWQVGEAIPAALAAGLPVHADVVVDADPDVLLARLATVREAGATVTSLTLHLPLPTGALVEPGRPTPAAWLRAVSLARLLLDVPHVVASPATQGLDASQAALLLGADDLGVVGTGLAPAVGDGAVFEASVEAAERALRVAGLEAVRRDLACREVGGALTRLRTVRPVSERARST